MWLAVHGCSCGPIDDCDMVGEDESILHQIYQRVNSIWESKLVDPAYMLGIRREVTYTCGGEMEVELTMTAFVDAMAAAFAILHSKLK